ncbi:MAG: nitroreductase family protein [Anaerolineae bacterium]|jgi:coenzyme F420-0:L-glutamate ligase / coenzyme F420-1:gamma-L-glutamate ligase|nr:nitroreductase family protein [Anaerolineae bacterium]MBT7074175.1 nitroreductase family protein [Anaerolineae bacterium]MBT7783801.1 nitroreductase family protein [Anaerolineae bacterium]
MNKLHQFLKTRRSIRRFKPDPVPAHVMEAILHTSTFAPSAHNLQPWRFVQVESDSAKEKLGNALTTKMRTDMELEGALQADIQKRIKISLRRISEAPIIIILCRDIEAIRENKREDEIMGIQSIALAGLQLLLAAEAEKVSGNWICWVLYAQKETISALELPKNWLPEAMLFLGYADEEPEDAKHHTHENLTIKR